MSDPFPAIDLADICVLCSETEGLSNVIIEYMLAGKPVICTDVGGNAELVLPGKTGELVACNSVEGFGTAIASLLDDPARAASYGREGRLRTSELFTASAMIGHHTSLYRELAESSLSNSAR
jgi:glycosyltransferase involved in cell wall biosynthesis